jgi:adenylyltransferase/sulfurtransferase
MAAAQTIRSAELAERIGPGAARDFALVDVREPWEAQIVQLPGSRLVPLGTIADAEFDPDVPVILYCHHGVRSERALRILADRGLTVSHLEGGIAAYQREADRSLPTY